MAVIGVYHLDPLLLLPIPQAGEIAGYSLLSFSGEMYEACGVLHAAVIAEDRRQLIEVFREGSDPSDSGGVAERASSIILCGQKQQVQYHAGDGVTYL